MCEPYSFWPRLQASSAGPLNHPRIVESLSPNFRKTLYWTSSYSTGEYAAASVGIKHQLAVRLQVDGGKRTCPVIPKNMLTPDSDIQSMSSCQSSHEYQTSE